MTYRFWHAVALAGLLLAPNLAWAQSAPNFSYGQVPTAGQWKSYFAAKQDSLGYRPLNRAGDTMTGPLYFAPSTVTKAGVNVAPGVDPSNPQNGDVWVTPSGFYIRANNTTYNLSGGPIACSQLPALVGDVTTTAGTCSTTLPNVNSNVGAFGSASQVAAFTVNAKGLITGASQVPIAITLSQVTNAGTAASANTGTAGGVLGFLNASKTDSGNNTYTGTNTFSAKTIFTTPTSTQASANYPPGATPTSPVNGDLWTTSLGAFLYYGGTTHQVAPLDSPQFTGTPTAPTGALGSSTQVATQAYVANAIAALPLGQGFRNRLINGDDRIDQRNSGAAQTITAGAALVYTTDRFYAYATGANVTGQRVAGGTNATPSQYRYQFTGAASVTGITRCQRIEAANSYDMAGQSAIFAVDLADSTLTSVGWSVSYANTADTFGTVASPTTTTISSGTFTVNATLARYTTAAISIPAAATTGLQVCLSVGAQTSGTWLIGTEQFEMGAVATAFERRPIATEFALAQRYYMTGLYGYAAGTTTGAGISVGTSINILPMRINPIATTGTQAGTNTSAASVNIKSNVAVSYTAATSASGGYILEGFFSLSAEL